MAGPSTGAAAAAKIDTHVGAALNKERGFNGKLRRARARVCATPADP